MANPIELCIPIQAEDANGDQVMAPPDARAD